MCSGSVSKDGGTAGRNVFYWLSRVAVWSSTSVTLGSIKVELAKKSTERGRCELGVDSGDLNAWADAKLSQLIEECLPLSPLIGCPPPRLALIGGSGRARAFSSDFQN